MNKEDIRLDLLRKLELKPEYTQRELSQEMGVSLGKINYCMKKFIEKGWIKLSNFSNNPNKVNYIYLLYIAGNNHLLLCNESQNSRRYLC